ncbi:MAG: hypothetical protein GVY18_09000 [Bacteroidetes bacterium]|jgi:glycine cleavage system aminomethyltransferase T|nr:hypothetical protein [Bacteroidota bacterium]
MAGRWLRYLWSRGYFQGETVEQQGSAYVTVQGPDLTNASEQTIKRTEGRVRRIKSGTLTQDTTIILSAKGGKDQGDWEIIREDQSAYHVTVKDGVTGDAIALLDAGIRARLLVRLEAGTGYYVAAHSAA